MSVLEYIKAVPDWIKVFSALSSGVSPFIKLWQGNSGLVTLVLCGIFIILGIYGCYHFAYTRTVSRIGNGEIIWRYSSRWRRVARIGLITIPLLSVCTVGYFALQWFRVPNYITIVVADFEGPDPKNYRVTETLIEQLRQVTKKFPDAKIQALGEAVTAVQGSDIARAKGKSNGSCVASVY